MRPPHRDQCCPYAFKAPKNETDQISPSTLLTRSHQAPVSARHRNLCASSAPSTAATASAPSSTQPPAPISANARPASNRSLREIQASDTSASGKTALNFKLVSVRPSGGAKEAEARCAYCGGMVYFELSADKGEGAESGEGREECERVGMSWRRNAGRLYWTSQSWGPQASR